MKYALDLERLKNIVNGRSSNMFYHISMHIICIYTTKGTSSPILHRS